METTELAETRVLTYILKSQENFELIISKGVTPAYFHFPSNNLISVILYNYHRLYSKGFPTLDIMERELSTFTQISDSFKPDALKTYEKLLALAAASSDPVSDIDYRLDELKQAFLARSVKNVLDSAITTISKEQDVTPAIEKLIADLYALDQKRSWTAAETKSLTDDAYVKERWDRYLHVKNDPDHGGELKTGMAEIDSRIGGLRPGELMVLVGRHGCGKSACMNSIATNIFSDQHNILLAGLEMSQDLNALRFDSRQFGLPYGLLRDGCLSESQEAYLESELMSLTDYPQKFYVVPQTKCQTIQDIQREMLLAQQRDNIKIDLVVIDYLNIMDSITLHSKKVDNWQAQRILVEEARAMGILNNVAVLTAAQANRSGTDKNAKTGTEIIALGDFIGATADYVIRLMRGEREIQGNYIHSSFLKNRHGAQGEFDLKADLNLMYVGNMDQEVDSDVDELDAGDSEYVFGGE